MRTISSSWAKQAKVLNRSQDGSTGLPNKWISRSGRIRKIKDVSRKYFGTTTAKSDNVITVAETKSEEKVSATNFSEKVETESVAMRAEVAPKETVEEAPKQESVKDKARVNADLLQQVLSESVEEWFNFKEVIKSNKGKPYKKRKILLPPMDESDFCFEWTETKNTVKKPEEGDKETDSASNKETSRSEESKKDDGTSEINRNDEVNNAAITKVSEMTVESVDENAKKENERLENEGEKSSKRDEARVNEKEQPAENGKNKKFRHFFALILYGDEVNGGTESDLATSDSEQNSSSQRAKTVIKTLDLETADLKEFEVELGDFCKLPKDSPISECVNGIEKLLQTGTTGSSPSEECLNALPTSDKVNAQKAAKMLATLPSGQRKMNLKTRECLVVLRNDIVQKFVGKAGGKMNKEAEKENRNEVIEADEKEKEQTEKAKELGKENNVGDAESKKKPEKETLTSPQKDKAVEKAQCVPETVPVKVFSVEDKNKPKTNEDVPGNGEKEEVNGPVEEKVEAEVEIPEMTVVTNTTLAKTKKLVKKKEMDNEKVTKMSGRRYIKRKQLGQARDKLDKLCSYVNTMKRKSGYKSSSESADSLNFSNEEPTPKRFESNQETRVDEVYTKQETDAEETREIRKSQREIKLTPKLVHMIATSHKRARRSPSIREDSVEDTDYEYPNLIKKVVSGSATPEIVEPPPSVGAIENYLQSKIDANASDLECSWQPGDLVWARFAGSPFWPSLVLRDPFSNDEYTKVKHLGRFLKPFVHLQFLADAGRRAWVPQVYCMNFSGLDEFEKKKSNLPELKAFAKRNDLVYQKAFFPKKKKAWTDAVEEGESLVSKSKEERITYMKMKYPLVKYAGSVTNVPLESNGTTSDELQAGCHPCTTRKRKTASSSRMESLGWSDFERATTSEEVSNTKNETFECVSPPTVEDNENGNERQAPKITLKFVRSLKKNKKREWSNSSENVESQLVKKPKKYIKMSLNKISDSEVTVKSQKKKTGGRKEEVCEVCLRMLGRKNVIKCNGVCTGVIPRGSRKKMGAKVGRLEESAAPALKKKTRRQKFSSPRVSKWKEKLWSIFDFYTEYGGYKREGMDKRGLVSLYRSLCDSNTENSRQWAG